MDTKALVAHPYRLTFGTIPSSRSKKERTGFDFVQQRNLMVLFRFATFGDMGYDVEVLHVREILV
jgi:hypothetical protein